MSYEITCADSFDLLARLIDEMSGPANWDFSFVDEGGAKRFVITVHSADNYDPENKRWTAHFHPVPIATYNEKTWRRWLFDRCRASMDHELGEMVRWGDVRPFAPTHGPGECPYTVREYRDPLDALTTQNGKVRRAHGSQEACAREDLSSDVVEVLRDQMWTPSAS